MQEGLCGLVSELPLSRGGHVDEHSAGGGPFPLPHHMQYLHVCKIGYSAPEQESKFFQLTASTKIGVKTPDFLLWSTARGRPFCHVCMNLVGHLYTVYVFECVLEKCTENGLWPPVIPECMHSSKLLNPTYMYMYVRT